VRTSAGSNPYKGATSPIPLEPTSSPPPPHHRISHYYYYYYFFFFFFMCMYVYT
jgi:hypothetical protein